MIKKFAQTIVVFAALLLLTDTALYLGTPQPSHAATNTGIYSSSRELVLDNGGMDAALVAALQPGLAVKIRHTSGGSLHALLALRRHDVIIDGHCVSACVWLLVSSPRACFSKQTHFFFHAWHLEIVLPFQSHQLRDIFTFMRHDKSQTQTYINATREPIRSEITELLQTSESIYVPTELFVEAYPDRICT